MRLWSPSRRHQWPRSRRSRPSVQAAKLDDDLLRAGKWTVKGQIDDIQVPGMPPELAAQMKARGAAMAGTESCVTEADAKKPAADFFTGDKRCK